MATTQQPQAEFVKALSRLDATALVVGSMIGSGIFIVSAEMLREVHAPGLLLVVWAASGIVTLMGALTYGELAAMFPRAGGQYVYLREAISPLFGYLYGWTLFVVIQTVTIAAVGCARLADPARHHHRSQRRGIGRQLRRQLLGYRRRDRRSRDYRRRDGRFSLLDGRVEQRGICGKRAQERPARPPGRHGGGRAHC